MGRTSKRKLFIVSLYALLTTGLPGLFFSSAYAVSSYDDLVKPVTALDAGFSWNNPAYQSLPDADFMQYFTEYCPTTAVNSFLDAVERGTNFAILQQNNVGETERHPTFVWQNNTSGDFTGSWSESDTPYNSSKSLMFSPTGGATHMRYYLSYDSSSSPAWSCSGYTSSYSIAVAHEDIDKSWNMSMSVIQPYISTFNNFTNPPDYEGTDIPNGLSMDIDGDGLTGSQENSQGTSILKEDTDGDGLSDLDESITYNAYYGMTYCDQSSPFLCAHPDPLEKDLFIEVDWMENGVDAPFKPSSTQLGLVEAMFDSKGINVHFDTGEYGGGEAVDYYSPSVSIYGASGELDLHDYKYGGSSYATGIPSYTLRAHFDDFYREGVWRYILYGVDEIRDLQAEANPGTYVGGVAEVLGDDSIIASENSGYFDSYEYTEDRAKAGLLAHEIGHLLCLSDDRVYEEHSEDCTFDDIDSSADDNYLSVMNYKYTKPAQEGLEDLDYSSGNNGSSDFDDWNGVQAGMGGFIHLNNFTALAQGAEGKAKRNNRKSNGREQTNGVSEIRTEAWEKAKNKRIEKWQDSQANRRLR